MKTSKLIILSIVALFASAITLTAAPASENWENLCASCHGAEGKGDTKQGKRLKLTDLTNPATLAEKSDEDIAKIIGEGVVVDGKQRKKGYADQIAADELTELVKFVREMAPKS